MRSYIDCVTATDTTVLINQGIYLSCCTESGVKPHAISMITHSYF